MATTSSTIKLLLDQLGADVTAKKMFGEYALYRAGVMFALVCDNQLFIKQTDAGREFLGTVEEAPPYPGAKNAFLITGDRWDDDRWLSQLARLSAEALATSAPKRKRPKKPKRT